MRRVAMTGVVWLGLCTAAAAQTAVPDRPGPYIIDVRGATVSLPGDSSFFPPVPSSTAVPSRGYGVDVGAHVYLLQLGPARLGIGGMLLRARGTVSASPRESDSDEEEISVDSDAVNPDVATLLTTAAPQISLNFGSRAGWSYLSAGIGRARITTRASEFIDQEDEGVATPARLLDGGTRSSVNFGGGARWFAKSRLAFSFDVRFHVVGAGGDAAITPRTTLVAVAAGMSLR